MDNAENKELTEVPTNESKASERRKPSGSDRENRRMGRREKEKTTLSR